ncbi:hypothetical protein MK489_00420 [Myxococcota bacterium]|nr:hypothetical protein [Myxococcota bacterium]
MSNEARVVAMIERIYDAAIEPSAWETFSQELSTEFGGAAVLISVERQSVAGTGGKQLAIYSAGILDDFIPVLLTHLEKGLPWGKFAKPEFLGRFAPTSELYPDDQLKETAFYTDFMSPQGLEPEGPLGHVIHADPEGESSGIGIYRRVGGRPFNPQDIEFGNRLVPHLARAFDIQRQLGGYERERIALTEVMDRLPNGVVLLDSRGRPVTWNRSAERIADRDDGFRIEADGPRLWNSQENVMMRKLIESAIESGLQRGEGSGQFMPISRPSGRRPLVTMVTSLLKPAPQSSGRDAVAALFVSDPSDAKLSTSEVLKSLYSLTRAEAELVGLLASGKSLEEVANERGITMNTARSQLKQVFAKTDTRRQGELVQIVLTGIATIDLE